MLGCPVKLTESLIAKVEELASLGLYTVAIAPLVGVTDKTFRRWLARGKREVQRLLDNPDATPSEGESLYGQLAIAKHRGESEFCRGNVEAIKRASGQYWQASAWLLERRFPEQWSLQAEKLRQIERELKELKKELRGDKS